MFEIPLLLCAGLFATLDTPTWHPINEYVPATPPANLLATADLQGTPGKETVLAVGAALHCIGTDGAVVWKTEGGALPGTPTQIAVTRDTAYDEGLVGVISGTAVVVLDGPSGTVNWQEDVGEGRHWLAWVNVDGQHGRELVVMSEQFSVRAYDTSGIPLWHYEGLELAPESRLLAPMTWGDSDGDEAPEGYGVSSTGFFRLGAMGILDWLIESEATVAATPLLVGDVTLGDLTLVVLAQEAIYGLEAFSGDPLWTRANSMGDSIVGCFTAADLDRDGEFEWVASIGNRMLAASVRGELRWEVEAPPATDLLAVDVDGDTQIELLALHGEKPLSIYGPDGLPETLPSLLQHEPYRVAFGDLLDKGYSNVALLGKQRLGLLRLNTPFEASLFPWPASRANAEQSNFAAQPDPLDSILFWEDQDLVNFGDFEYGDLTEGLIGWTAAEGSTAALTDAGAFAGTNALAMAGSPRAVVMSQTFRCAPELRGLTVEILGQHEDGSATLQWMKGNAVRSEILLEGASLPNADWTRHAIMETPPPLGADGFRIVLQAHGNATWDNFSVLGRFLRLPRAHLHLNGVGYEYRGTKHFVLATNQRVEAIPFQVLDETEAVVFEGSTAPSSRIVGAYGNDWGAWYTSGDFTFTAKEGQFRVRATIEGLDVLSKPFSMVYDTYWTDLMPQLLRPFLSPTAHAQSQWAALFDEAPESAPEILWHITNAYWITQWKTNRDLEDSSFPLDPWLDGIAYGAKKLAAAHFAAPRDAHTTSLAALARTLRVLPDAPYRGAVLTAAKQELLDNPAVPHCFPLAMDCWMVSQEPAFKAYVESHFPEPTSPFVESMVEAETELNAVATFPIMVNRGPMTDALVARADNPFGVMTYGAAGKTNFFNTPPHSEVAPPHNENMLQAALEAVRTYRFAPQQAHFNFIYHQLSWLLGCNPEDQVLVDLAGTGRLHQSFVGAGPMDDRPFLPPPSETRPLVQQLRENALFIDTLAQFKRIPSRPPESREP